MMHNERLISLDALRGFTILAMIIVNTPGSWSHVYAPLLHAPWHGLTPTDLVFPFFLFIVGISVTLAYSKRLAAGVSPNGLYGKILFRGLKIFALGLFLNLWPRFDFESIRIAGVLQRIAVVFVVCAFLYLNLNWKRQLWTAAALLLGYWALMAWAPVPIDDINHAALANGFVERSYGTKVEVDIEAAGEKSLKANYEPGTNLAAWMDRQVLPGRFWEKCWDPEGLFSTFPAIATGLLGMLIGSLLLGVRDAYRRMSWVFLAGFILFCLGIVMSWGFPINKNLWSSSFVLVTAGLSTLCLGTCVFIVDTLGHARWTKLGVIFGANPVVAYALSGMLTVVFYRGYGDFAGLNSLFMNAAMGLGIPGKLASLCYALFYVGVLFVPVYLLWRKKIFVRL